jgi:glyoxylase-like metal-dependent hydrolase (beta-lactamase superfamily II)
MQLIFEQVRVGGDRNFGYLLGDRAAHRAVLIDPSYAPEALVERAAEQGLQVTHIINTHGHPDHVNGNDQAIASTGAPVAGHPGLPTPPDVALRDGQEIAVGALRLRFLDAPGHADDHLVVYEPGYQLLITGDLLFVGKIGGTRTERDARTEWNSLQRLLQSVPDTATVWPGHDYGVRPSSTIALERKTNPFLLCADAEALIRLKEEWPEFKKHHGLK